MLAFIRIALAALAMLAAAAPASAAATSAQKEEIGKLVREYLLANPEVLEEAITELRKRRDEEASIAQTKAIEDNSDLIFGSDNQVVLGNPEGSITLVEFFDYNCTYCRRAVSDMTALIDANPDLRVVLKEFPILAEGSIEAARIAVAVKDLAPQSYLQFHTEMFSRPGQADEEKALEVARDIGLDGDALKDASTGSDVTANLQEVRDLATALGITGTPSYVLGRELFPGAVGFDTLQKRVAAIRDCGVTLC
jgi:protein-disulfide isomerase